MRFMILIHVDDATPPWQAYRDPTGDPVTLQLDAAERFAYGAYINTGATAVRLESDIHAFLWRRDDDGRPREQQRGRADACINGRWWQYRPHCMIHNPGDAEALANAARVLPAVQAVQHGGPDYHRDLGE